MREILFRGKRTDNGTWMCGNLTIWSDGTASIDKEPTEASPLYAVIPETIGQYTGLTDKNGKKIFEGDIVRENYGECVCDEKLVVSMKVDRGGWYPFACGDGCGCCEYETWSTENAEVIGNIHDNPELLKGEQ